MSYHLEIWLKGFANDQLKAMREKNDDSYHPHITLARPFTPTIDPQILRSGIIDYCKPVTSPLPFSLEGRASFDGKFRHVPVVDCYELLRFDAELERILENGAILAPKLDKQKNLHATVNQDEPIEECPRIDQYMLRLTGMHDRKIWFQYDFVTRKVLTREQALDKALWKETVAKFSADTGIMPTRDGFIRIF